MVRKYLLDFDKTITAENLRGQEYAKSCYLDIKEEVKKMNPNYLHLWNLNCMAIAAPLKSTGNSEGCLTVITDRNFGSVLEAKSFLASVNPKIVECASMKEIEKFVVNPSINLAKSCKISKLYSGRNVVLIGDAAHPFKPIGQGINVAMLDGMNLDLAISNYHRDDLDKAL